MHAAHLSLVDFRSYSAAEVELAEGATVFVGPNGEGKTNLVEALGYIATQTSHRVASDNPLIRDGAERAIVRASIVQDGRPALVELEIVAGRSNRARLNRAPVPRAREVIGILRTVLFAPEDLALVKGDPSERRGFLDDLLVVRAPRFAGVRQDYDRVLRQRNALLKSAGGAARAGRADLSTLDVWDNHLAIAGAELLAGRLELAVALEPRVVLAYETLAPGRGTPSLAYRSSVDSEDPLPPDREVIAVAMRAALTRVRRSELERGITLVGPHRDDLVLGLGDLPAKGYASHGESWSLALALRLAAYALLRAEGGEPVLVLDDVFAELDVTRRELLAAAVAPAEQVLVTAAVPADVPAALDGARYDVHAGTVVRTR